MTAPAFVFDVESIGLHGEAFGVAGAVSGADGVTREPFMFGIPRAAACGSETDRAWVDQHVPPIPVTHTSGRAMRDAFWARWLAAKAQGAIMVAWCAWPVEARFLAACVDDDPAGRAWDGPFPLHDLATLFLARNIHPTEPSYERGPNERIHDPMGDVRYTARLWFMHANG
ncbi:MAG TPA: hypothetical protein PKE12_02160 [Kiritimatiellia bacterium]|nr:hypothetical protein [Kiritimatiellia bacterium]